MECRAKWSLLVCVLALGAVPVRAADPLQLVDGDRVVWIGNTLIEREQRYGYWETMLTCRFPDKNVSFRNLGWSGDTVFGDAQAGFGSAADGYRHRQEHIASLKPTLIFVAYGFNESFEGQAGLPRFVEGLNTLLEALAQTKARIILVGPLRHEDLGRPLPDPAEHNRNLRLYRAALRQAADRRGLRFVDLYDLLPDGARATPPAPLTDNGIHLTAYGYWRSAAAVEQGLGLKPPAWQVELNRDGKVLAHEGARVVRQGDTGLAFQITDATLPVPRAPTDSPAGATLAEFRRVLRVHGLPPGKYALKIDGKQAATATAGDWESGVVLQQGPEFEQVERLREAIIEKNHLYFYRWRPQNETYLFGFRKHEQGKNAVEIPKFDPLVAKAEADIARLRVPVAHRYEIVAEKVGGK